jgi:hypothetical protein
VANVDPALEQQILDVPQRQRPMLGSKSGKRPASLFAPIAIGADVFLIQMASIVKVSVLGHSKHRIQRS